MKCYLTFSEYLLFFTKTHQEGQSPEEHGTGRAFGGGDNVEMLNEMTRKCSSSPHMSSLFCSYHCKVLLLIAVSNMLWFTH